MTRGPDPEPIEFQGYWEQKGLIKVPVMPKDDYSDLFDFGPGYTGFTSEPVTDRDHVPSHAGYTNHLLDGETPCPECEAAERMFNHNLGQ